LIDESWRLRLHEYLRGTLEEFSAIPQCCGGVADRVHLLIELKATHCLADLMRKLKKSSTKCVREHFNLSQFSWQDGYAPFSVGSTSLAAVQGCIGNQEEHHRTLSFRDKFKAMLDRAEIV